MFVFGTRPEAIKMAPLVLECQNNKDVFDVVVCVTGQHRQMLDQVLALFDIVPDYDLNIMKAGQDLFDVSSAVLLGLREVLSKENPNIVLVHGDTTTSMTAALAAFYKQIPVGHIEAGLRTYNIYSPWPEEMNRQITGRISTINFAPTELSRKNLLSEGVVDSSIHVVGNSVIDALYLVLGQIRGNSGIEKSILSKLDSVGVPSSMFLQWKVGTRSLVLVTGHRRENFGDGFINICRSVRDLSQKYPNVDFVYPMHLNPNVRRPIAEVFGEDYKVSCPNVYLIEPLDYLPFVYMMSHSAIVLTDSGGIQEEAPGLGKPVLVMRDTTERPEAVEAGTVKLVGTNYDVIVKSVSLLLENKDLYIKMSKALNPYGDGKTSKRVVEILEIFLNNEA